MENLGFGLEITIAGMGIVFGLLAVLWLLLTIAVRLDGRASREAGPAAESPAPGSGSSAGGPSPAGQVHLIGAPDDVDPRLLAAVTVAVLRHADARRRQAAPAMRSYWPGSLLFASRWVAAGRMRQGQSWRRRPR